MMVRDDSSAETITFSNLSPETRASLKALCKKKAEEFKMLGYNISPDAIWTYVEHRFKTSFHLYEVVEVLLHLRIQTWMQYATKEAFMAKDSWDSLL